MNNCIFVNIVIMKILMMSEINSVIVRKEKIEIEIKLFKYW